MLNVKCYIALEIDGVYKVKKRRENDVILMEKAISIYGDSPTKLDRINRVRMYLQVECLSDIWNASGTCIANKPMIHSDMLWPNIAEPGPKSYEAWRDFLKEFTHDKSNKLRKMLGKWQYQPNKWDWMYDPVSDLIAEYKTELKQYVHHEIKKKNRRHFDIETKITYGEAELSRRATPVDPLSANQMGKPSNWIRCKSDPVVPKTFEEYIEMLPDWERELIQLTSFNDSSSASLMELIESGEKVYAASDGGVSLPHGYYGWAIGTEDETICYGSGPVYGWPLSSARAEGYGRLSLLRFLYHYQKFYGHRVHPEFKMQMACDNRSIVNQEKEFIHEQHKWTPSSTMQPNYDLSVQINEAIKQLPVKYEIEWVKGHQDDRTSFGNLSRLAQLNVIADHLATQERWRIWNLSPNKKINGPTLPASKATLYRRGSPITGHEKRYLKRSWTAKQLRKYLVQRFGHNKDQTKQMHWRAYRTARKAVPRNIRRFITKMQMEWLPTNGRLKTIYGTTQECVHCGQTENTRHILCCNHRLKQQDEFIHKLKTFLDNQKTPVEITNEIVNGIKDELKGKQGQQPKSQLTWWDFIMGHIDTKWEERIDTEHRIRGRLSPQKYNGASWCKNTIAFLWSRLYEFWITRNEEVYSKESKSNFQRERAKQRIEYLYSLSPVLLARDREYFLSTEIEELLELSTRSLQDWLVTFEEAILLAAHEAEREVQDTHRTITSYFNRTQ